MAWSRIFPECKVIRNDRPPSVSVGDPYHRSKASSQFSELTYRDVISVEPMLVVKQTSQHDLRIATHGNQRCGQVQSLSACLL